MIETVSIIANAPHIELLTAILRRSKITMKPLLSVAKLKSQKLLLEKTISFTPFEIEIRCSFFFSVCLLLPRLSFCSINPLLILLFLPFLQLLFLPLPLPLFTPVPCSSFLFPLPLIRPLILLPLTADLTTPEVKDNITTTVMI